jgi:Hypothetical glycosyl hydrolase family 15
VTRIVRFVALVGSLVLVLSTSASAGTSLKWAKRLARTTTTLSTTTSSTSTTSTTVPAGQATGPTSAGSVRFEKGANSAFDPYTSNPTTAQQQWMRDHYARMLTYSPYFDSRTSWYPSAWTYLDAYALYVNDQAALVAAHPDWVLHDAGGNMLYIPYGCSGTTCPQYAGDFGNPDFRSWWIGQAQQALSHGYAGLFMDDVNMDWRVGNGSGATVTPVDPRTGTAMTIADWRRYMAEFTEQVRQAFPTIEIAHNVIWYAGGSAGDTDPYIQRELKAANVVNLERGVNDGGITGGGGTFGYDTFLGYVDHRHASGQAVDFDADASTEAATQYGMASYLLINDGSDLMGNTWRSVPDDWWSGYSVALGSALGARYSWNGMVRRDFQGGIVLVNEPGASQKTVALPATYLDPDGVALTSVTLGPASGVVLRAAP